MAGLVQFFGLRERQELTDGQEQLLLFADCRRKKACSIGYDDGNNNKKKITIIIMIV